MAHDMILSHEEYKSQRLTYFCEKYAPKPYRKWFWRHGVIVNRRGIVSAEAIADELTEKPDMRKLYPTIITQL